MNSVFQKHSKKIAFDTLKMSEAGASIMGGMTHKKAINFLRKEGYSDAYLVLKLQNAGHTREEIARFFE